MIRNNSDPRNLRFYSYSTTSLLALPAVPRPSTPRPSPPMTWQVLGSVRDLAFPFGAAPSHSAGSARLVSIPSG